MSYIQYTRGLQSRKARETLLKDASSVHPIRMDEFDKDPYTLNCEKKALILRISRQAVAEGFLHKFYEFSITGRHLVHMFLPPAALGPRIIIEILLVCP